MWEEGRQDMWSLALVEEVGKQHSYTMKREGAASAGHMQFAGGKKSPALASFASCGYGTVSAVFRKSEMCGSDGAIPLHSPQSS